jgi:AtzE family amidohydrolase
MSIEWMSALEIADAIKTGELSAREVAQVAIARARTVGQELNCYTAILEERAMKDADRVDAARAAGGSLGPLAGVPVAVKSLFDIAGEVTLAGSIINKSHPPAQKDSTALRRLFEAGAVLVGALGMDEYAYGFTNENTHYGAVRNPHDRSRSAGGSSGGSGAAVAGGCVPGALGTDTNGSVRVPASLCGLFGLKPTYGRVSRAGAALFTPSLDHVGFLTRSARDASAMFDCTHGFDPADPVSSPREREETLPTIEQGLRDLRIGRAVGYFEDEATDESLVAARQVAEALAADSAHIIPETKAARHAAMILSGVEGSAVHIEDLRTRPADFDPMSRDRFLAGALLPGEAYVRAQRFRLAFQNLVRDVFQRVDVLVAPATPMVAPKIGQEVIEFGGGTYPSRAHLGRFTQPLTLVGLPVVVIPMMTASGMPIGVQLVGRPYSEAALLRAARHLEREGVSRVVRPAELS